MIKPQLLACQMVHGKEVPLFFVSVLTEAECVHEIGCVCTSLLSFSMPLCVLDWQSYEIGQSVPIMHVDYIQASVVMEIHTCC